MASQPSTPLKPSLLYTIYFLTFEPLAALGGTYLALFNPTRYLRGTLPSTIPTPPISPLIYSLLVNIGSLYFLFAVAEGVVLRLTRKRSVWFAVLGAFCVTDVCHYAEVLGA
ncbi:hypothetical protein M7I_7138 [Glarea lozoyensis 74030]|uniref:DUF7704 domain-containing protein n=1 Tax=Glarea lozoyensis (strain ATCC 74030 / MF5533) TaxID=1104152 RepID=H0EWH2_GLAL7|nr:hypothetical protein M7I_7138 [Glarea lozoyensis 74030]